MKRQEDLIGVVTDLALAIQAVAVYPESHQRVQELLSRLHQRTRSEAEKLKNLHIGFLGYNVFIDDFPLL